MPHRVRIEAFYNVSIALLARRGLAVHLDIGAQAFGKVSGEKLRLRRIELV
jgi:hypothetical protein